ncbi:MAG: DUF512 domain-containing protein [Clostridioides sp.]|jgi:putative radical SAM enzyme (TIGR03279 family)|nr:DUF512 domain-containing protein [Clostridioides sp.]
MEVNVKKANNIINKIVPESIAEELGIEVGDFLISINNQPIHDIIEYRFLLSDEYLEVEIEGKDGEVVIFEIEKEYDEDLGIEFSNPIIDKAKSCRNKCVFCFVDQLPSGMRETLYFKDDDSRLSFLQGNFVTLTNMSEEDIDSIIKYRISPINISVHTTNPELRQKMINNRFAGELYNTMKRLADANITMNCQVVLCPGYNDGEELDRTVRDLETLYPNVNSIAVVPVGITKYRENLAAIKIFDSAGCKDVIEQVEGIQEKLIGEMGTRFIFLSDEFYVSAGVELPPYEAYEGFLQFEDGVGMIRKLGTEIEEELNTYPDDFEVTARKISIATGHSAYGFISEMASKIMNKFPTLNIQVFEIKNNFLGETITVSGLLTAGDLLEQLGDVDLGEALYITRSMLKADELIFLDDITLDGLIERLGVKVVPCENRGKDALKSILGR